MILALIDLSWLVLFAVIIVAAIIGWYLLKFAIWILIVIILVLLILAGLDLVFGFLSSLL
jgi:hypothetical protein